MEDSATYACPAAKTGLQKLINKHGVTVSRKVRKGKAYKEKLYAALISNLHNIKNAAPLERI